MTPLQTSHRVSRTWVSLWAGVCSVAGVLALSCGAPAEAQGGNTADSWGMTHTASVDRGRTIMTSGLRLGFTHTHKGLDQPGAESEAVDRARQYLRDAEPAFQNTHIIGWGPGNLQRGPGEPIQWGSLDARMRMMRELDIPMVMTLCTAPGWMKTSGDTWQMNSSPKDEHFDDFAALCVEVAKRYPEVRHFQVWNEFKGFWDNDNNTWNADRYTRLYNTIYDALKAHDPTLKVGGLYLILEGTGSAHLGYKGWQTAEPITPRNLAVMKHWLENKHGADFICIDKGLKDFHDKHPYSAVELIGFTENFQSIGRQVRELTDLPIWWSEYYAASGTEHQRGAAFASIYRHMLLGDTNVALLWNPIAGEVPCQMLTDVKDTQGGQPEPHYFAYAAFQRHFSAGRPIFHSESSTDRIEVLASDTATMVINKFDVAAKVRLDGKLLKLRPYEVRVLEVGE